MNFLVVKNISQFFESVNPVYRRRRLAKVAARSRFHQKMTQHWSGVMDKLDKRHDQLARRRASNAEFNDINAKRISADDAYWHNHRKMVKAYKISKGRADIYGGADSKYRLRPANPLRKNREETYGKHKITVADMLKARKYDKQVKADSHQAAKQRNKQRAEG